MRVLVLNGPNLGRLGRRQPDVYGTTTHAELAHRCVEWGRELGLAVEVRQTNHEGEMLDWLKRHRSDLVTSIESTGQLTDDNVESLQSGLNEFKDLFKRGDTGIHLNEPDAEAMEEGRETHETVTREVRRPAGATAADDRAEG